jgi:hypothetical protein
MTSTLYVDVFPVDPQALPQLFAYSAKTISDDSASIGGKLAYRLRNKFGGNWIWCNNQLVSDVQVPETRLREHLRELWANEGLLKNVQHISARPSWIPSAWDQAEFAARGLLANYQSEIRRILDPKKMPFGKVRVDRDYNLRGWVVNNTPAISISVASNINHTQNLSQYASSLTNLQNLVGLTALVPTKEFKGEIVEVSGTVADKRDWLLSVSQDNMTRNLIQRAPDNEPTIKIETRTSKYIYIASMLRPIVRMEDLQRFNVNPRQVSRVLRLDPEARYALVREIAGIGKKYNIITNSFDSSTSPQAFLTAKDVGFTAELKVGKGHIVRAGQRVYWSLERYGLFNRATAFPDKDHPIRVGVINASPESSRNALRYFLGKLKTALEKLGFSLESVSVDGQRQQKIERLSRASLENAVNQLEPEQPDLLLALFPGDSGQEQQDDDGDSMYHVLKSHTIRRNIPSQVVYEDTFTDDYAMDNIALGILAKTRNIPFVLAQPLPYADIVVGIDIARRKKQKLSGSVNATAIARIYFNDGQFLRYVIHDAPLDGETIPPSVLRSLFPLKEFQGKRVVVHRDGLFRGEEKPALKNWAKQIGAEFHLVEVVKSGAPRLYQQASGVDKPDKGGAFKLGDTEAFLVSSPPPFKSSTPRPLQIRTEPTFPIERAIHSVLSLTLLHYGSVREPRLPVTIHYSDKIAELSLLGIKPKDLEGDTPFWL